jgi:cell shape-determining protein MreC
MRKYKQIKSLRSVVLIFVLLFFILSLAPATINKLRGKTVSFFTPFWSIITPSPNEKDEEISRLQLQNALLQMQNDSLAELVQNKELLQTSIPSTESIPARVIYRSPSSWNSSLWVNVGNATNRALNKNIIAKNSPVVLGTHVIGVVDFVDENTSRVRLITDSALTPSVRAARGGTQDTYLAHQLDTTIKLLTNREKLFSSPESQSQLISQLKELKNILINNPATTLYLAKGELHGSSKPLWRGNALVLKGVGFNYDFGDAYGPPRDLRTGKTTPNGPGMPLLKVDDLLTTTGMDGVLPPNFHVAIITKINPLKEGDFAYSLEALPTAPDLMHLTTVFILPPTENNTVEVPVVIADETKGKL